MRRPLPQLPKPELVLIRVEAPSKASAQSAIDLGETGIPAALIGYEYRSLSKPDLFAGIGERGVVPSRRVACSDASPSMVPLAMWCRFPRSTQRGPVT